MRGRGVFEIMVTVSGESDRFSPSGGRRSGSRGTTGTVAGPDSLGPIPELLPCLRLPLRERLAGVRTCELWLCIPCSATPTTASRAPVDGIPSSV